MFKCPKCEAEIPGLNVSYTATGYAKAVVFDEPEEFTPEVVTCCDYSCPECEEEFSDEEAEEILKP